MSAVPENPEIACNRRARNRSDGRKWALTVLNSRVGSQSRVQGTTKECWLCVHFSVCVQGTLLEKRGFLAQRLCLFLPGDRLAVVVSQETIVVGVGSIVNYNLTEAVVPRLRSDFLAKPC